MEEGKENWKDILSGFYGDFERELQAAEQDTERIKVPDEVSDVICPLCGRNLVFKSGRFAASWPAPAGLSAPTPSPSSLRCRASAPSAAAKF